MANLLQDPGWNRRALVLSLGLHALAAYYFLTHNAPPAKPPVRLEVEMAMQSPPAPEALVEPQKPEPVKIEKPVLRQVQQERVNPTPQTSQVALPVLTASDPAPATNQDYQAPEVAMPAAVESIPPGTSPGTEPPVASAAAPAAETASGDAVDDDALNGYGRLLYEYAKKNKNYPQIAIRRSLQGLVKVAAKLAQGKLVEVVIVESSGHKPLDDQALEMVRKAVSELPIKASLGKKLFTVVVPVEFKLTT